MKRNHFFRSTLALMIFAFSLSSCEKEVLIPVSELPSEIASYISTHFPKTKVLQVVKETGGFTNGYEVFLDGNIHLEFNGKKQIIDIDGVSKLPDSVIPEKLKEYVSNNYPKNVITDWEMNGRNQQIELDNGLTLKFNMSGTFLRNEL